MSDVILHPPVPLPEVVAFHQEHFPEVQRLRRLHPGPHASSAGTPTRSRSSRSTRACGYLVPVTKHHDGFCWWDSPTSPTRTSVRQGPHRDVIAELADAVAARTTSSSGSTTRCSTGGTPTTPTRSATSTATCARSSRTCSSGSSRSCSGATGTGVTPARWWRADRIVEDYYAAMDAAGLEGCVNDRFNATHADYAVYEYDVPEVPPDRRVGAVPRPVVLLLLQPGRARRRPPERAAARRDAHRGRGEGRQPAAERRAEGGRVDPRDPDAGCCATPAPG